MMYSGRRIGSIMFLAAVLVLGQVGVASAQRLTLQTWGGIWEDGARAVGDAFAKKFGVEIRYEQQVNTREGLARIRAQKSDPKVDILFSTADALQQATDEGLLVPINRKLTPNMASLPQQHVHAASVDTCYLLFGMVYRKDLVPFELTRYEDLLDPRLRGRVASPNALYASGRWVVMAALLNGGSEKNIDPAFDFLKKMKPNIVTFYVGSDQSKILQSGEAAVAALAIFSEFYKLLGPDSPYRFVLPKDKPVMTNMNGVGMPNPRNADVAQRFLDYMASAEAQESYATRVACTPVHPQAQPLELMRAYRPPAELIYSPDWGIINRSLPQWDDRFKKEIQTR